MGAGVAERRLRRLLHDVPHLPGQDQVPPPLHRLRLDVEDLPSDRRPGQPRGDPDLVARQALLGQDARRPETAAQPGGVDGHGVAPPQRELHGDLAADRGDLALEVAQPGLARVAADHLPQHRLGEGHVSGAQAVRLELLRHEVAARDLDLLLLGVSGEMDDLHAVPEGRLNRVENVGGRDEQDLGEVEGNT